ncbi:hypothetical protein AAMO2058_000756600, partial [Amorphochlora amoebiformis]
GDSHAIILRRNFGNGPNAVHPQCGEESTLISGACRHSTGYPSLKPNTTISTWHCDNLQIHSDKQPKKVFLTTRGATSVGICAPKSLEISPKFQPLKPNVIGTCPGNLRIVSGGCASNGSEGVEVGLDLGKNSMTCKEEGGIVCLEEKGSNYRLLPPVKETSEITPNNTIATATCNTSALHPDEQLFVIGGFCLGPYVLSKPMEDPMGWICRGNELETNDTAKIANITVIVNCVATKIPPLPDHVKTMLIPANQTQVDLQINTLTSANVSGLKLNRPVIMSKDNSMVHAKLQEDFQPRMDIPGVFSIYFQCYKKGIAYVHVLLFINKHKQYERIKFRLLKECEAHNPNEEAEPIKIQGFCIGSTSEGVVNDVVKDGIPSKPYSVNSSAPLVTHMPVKEFYMVAKRKPVMILEVNAMSSSASGIVSNILLGGRESEGGHKGLFAGVDGDMVVLVLKIDCLKVTTVEEIGIEIRTNKGPVRFQFKHDCNASDPVPEGWPILGMAIATNETLISGSMFSPDVAEDGIIMPKFTSKAIEKYKKIPLAGVKVYGGEEETAGVKVYGGEEETARFYVGANHELFSIRVGEAFVSEVESESRKRIMAPRITKSLEGLVHGNKIGIIEVAFECIAVGLSIGTVALPLKMHDGFLRRRIQSGFKNIEWYFVKNCTKPSGSVIEGSSHVPYLNVGLRTSTDIMKNGTLRPIFQPKPRSGKSFVIPKTVDILRLHVSANTHTTGNISYSNQDEDPNLYRMWLSGAVVIAHSPHVLKASVSDHRMSRHGVWFRSALALDFECTESGMSSISIILHITKCYYKTPDNRKRDVFRLRYSQHRVVIGMEKACLDPNHVPVNEKGGVFIPGLVISKEGDNPQVVVRNGFPTEKYFGVPRKQRGNKLWRSIIINETEDSSTFHISFDPSSVAVESTAQCMLRECALKICYDDAAPCPCETRCRNWVDYGAGLGSAEDTATSVIELDSPAIFRHDAKTSPVISGSASQGTRLSRANPVRALLVKWNCKRWGQSIVTFRIPVLDMGFIAFTIPKRCPKQSTPVRNMRVYGLMVGTKPPQGPHRGPKNRLNFHIFSGDVVSHGHARISWMPGSQKSMHTIGEADNSTFYLWKVGKGVEGRSIEIPELISDVWVMSHRHICNPVIQHNLPLVSTSNGNDSVLNTTERLNLSISHTEALALRDHLNFTTPKSYVIDVQYNCVWEGSTIITVILAIRGGGKIPFSWTKVCSAPEDNLGPVQNCEKWSTHISESEIEQDPILFEALPGRMAKIISDAIANETRNTGNPTEANVTSTPLENASIPKNLKPFVPKKAIFKLNAMIIHKCDKCDDGYKLVKGKAGKADRCVIQAEKTGTNSSNSDYPYGIWDADEDDYGESADHLGLNDEIAKSSDDFIYEHVAGEDITDNFGYESPRFSIGSNKKCYDESLMCDVAKDGIPTMYYSIVQRGKDDSVLANRVVHPEETETSFFIRLPEGEEKGSFEKPTIYIQSFNHQKDIVRATIKGAGAAGQTLDYTNPNTAFSVEYKCQKPGVVSVLVALPLSSASRKSLSFSYVKICGGFKKRRSTDYFTAPTLMYLSLFGCIVAGGVLVWLCLKSITNIQRYFRIPNDEPLRSMGSG